MSGRDRAGSLRRAFGGRIRALRTQRELSQIALGELAGLDHNYIGQIERGERNVSLEAIRKLAKGLRVEIVDLFRFSGETRLELHPQLIDILTLLENQKGETLQRVKDLVQLVMGWEGKE